MLITSFFNEQKQQQDRAGENREDEACGMHIKKQRQWRGEDEERISTTEKSQNKFSELTFAIIQKVARSDKTQIRHDT